MPPSSVLSAWYSRLRTRLGGAPARAATVAPPAPAPAPPPGPLAAAPFDALLDRLARHGDGWVRETGAVLVDLAVPPDAARSPAPARLPLPAVRAIPADARYALLRLALRARTPSVRARFAWGAAGATWEIPADGTMRTWALDLRPAPSHPAVAGDAVLTLLDAADDLRMERGALVADLAHLQPGDARAALAARYLRGHGIECGALQHPLPVPAGAEVTYVDRLTPAQARAHYPELDCVPLTRPHVVADLQRLPVGDGRVDFCIGNHLLEHARDPIGGLLEFLRAVRPGGVVFVSVPDRDNPLDRLRPVTPFDHVLADHVARDDRRAEDDRHYDEAVDSTHPTMDPERRRVLGAQQRAQEYSIHFHTFEEATFRRLVAWTAQRAGATIEEYVRNPTPDFDEYIAIVRRTASGRAGERA